MIGIARLFCYRESKFQLVEVPPQRAKEVRKKLNEDGWVVAHTEIL